MKLLLSFVIVLIVFAGSCSPVDASPTGSVAVSNCDSVCNSNFASNKDLCCVLNGYKKFDGCSMENNEFVAICVP